MPGLYGHSVRKYKIKYLVPGFLFQESIVHVFTYGRCKTNIDTMMQP